MLVQSLVCMVSRLRMSALKSTPLAMRRLRVCCRTQCHFKTVWTRSQQTQPSVKPAPHFHHHRNFTITTMKHRRHYVAVPPTMFRLLTQPTFLWFVGNRAQQHGGGIVVWSNARLLTFTGKITNNEATTGYGGEWLLDTCAGCLLNACNTSAPARCMELQA